MTDASEPPANGRGPILSLLSAGARAIALAGGVVMLAASVLVCVSVGLRWTTSNSVPGDFEWVQISVAVAAFCFLPYCQIRRGNINVTTFTSWLPARVQAGIDALWDLVYAGFAALIAWGLANGARDAIANGTTTMVVGIPIGWAILITAGLAAFLALVSVTMVLRLGRRGR